MKTVDARCRAVSFYWLNIAGFTANNHDDGALANKHTGFTLCLICGCKLQHWVGLAVSNDFCDTF